MSYVAPVSPSSSRAQSQLSSSALLYFKPETLTYITEKNTYTTSIYLDTQNTPVSAAQIELSYNPKIFYDVTISPAQNNLFGERSNYIMTLQDVRQEYGRASIALELQSNQREVQGSGPIGTLSFKVSPASGSATISFLDKSAVYGRLNRKSLLSNTTPFIIQLNP